MESSKFCVVLTTCGDRNGAQELARGLLEEKLAACVQMTEIRSLYWWKDEICTDPEILLLIKTSKSKYEAVEKFIKALHTYDVAELVCLPIEQGSPEYLGWLDQTLHR